MAAFRKKWGFLGIGGYKVRIHLILGRANLEKLTPTFFGPWTPLWTYRPVVKQLKGFEDALRFFYQGRSNSSNAASPLC